MLFFTMVEEALADEQARKRARMTVGYRPGSVMRVEVKNFMTYSNCVIEPGPTLNLVLGPNGTGKSSFVCALCVGLAGSTKLLGRADDIASFIRRGTDEGEVKVTLADDRGGKLVVRRRMRRTSNGAQNEWWVNGKTSTMTKVKDIVSKYNIQLDNLCQFLPQDKVSEFARMKPIELLKATEMAIGDGNLYNLHESLIKEKKDMDEKKKLVDMEGAAVARHEEELEELERALGPMREKKRLQEQMNVLKKHKAWREHDECVEEGKKDEEMLKKSMATLKRLNKEADSIAKGPVKVKSDQKKKAEQAKNTAAKEMGKHDVEKVNTDVGNHLTLAQGVHDQIQNLEEASNQWKAKIRMMENDVQNLKETVEQLTHQNDAKIEREIQMLDLQMKDLINQESTVARSQRDLEDSRDKLDKNIRTLKDQLGKENNKKYRALNNLAKSRPGVREIYDYVQKNRGRFKGQVVGPLVMEIDVRKKHYASILEQLLPFNWLSYVFVQYESDMKLLKRELEARNIEPLIAVVEADVNAPLNRTCGDSAKYASLGVEATLDETFQAHPMIKHALDNHFFISSIFVMAEGQKGWQKVFDANPKLQQVWTSEYQVRKTVSRYDASNTTISITELKDARILTASSSGDAGGACVRIKKELDDRMAQLERVQLELNELQPDIDRIKTHKNEIKAERTKLASAQSDQAQRLRNAKGSLSTKEKQLQMQKNREDPLKKKDKLVHDLKLHLAKALDKAVKMPNIVDKYKSALLKHATSDLATKELTEQIHVLGQKSKTKLKERNDMAELVDQLQQSVNRHREHVEQLKKNAVEETGLPIPEELKQEFSLLPQDLREIEESLAEKKAQHDSILISDPGAQQRYERITEILSTNKERLAVHEEAYTAISEKVEQLKQAWAPEVRSLVQQINRNFSEAFKHVGIAGEVVFNEADGDDFAKYSIDLRVKFREEGQLITLDSAYHSGGESSTSTILYLMALQGVTTSPFRVVDEINQGMDSINERSVFKLLADAATAPDTPQCFLLTPKLLPDLPFSEDVTVLQIMNGVHIGDIANGFRQDCLLGEARTAAAAPMVEAV